MNFLLSKCLYFLPFYSVALNDYIFVETEFIFPPGTEIGDIQCIGIPIENDDNAEPSENFSLQLVSTTPLIYIVPERKSYTVTISDNDRE